MRLQFEEDMRSVKQKMESEIEHLKNQLYQKTKNTFELEETSREVMVKWRRSENTMIELKNQTMDLEAELIRSREDLRVAGSKIVQMANEKFQLSDEVNTLNIKVQNFTQNNKKIGKMSKHFDDQLKKIKQEKKGIIVQML